MLTLDCMRRLQEPIANILATLIPRARIVPAVRGEDMSSDPEVRAVSFGLKYKFGCRADQQMCLRRPYAPWRRTP